MTPLEITNLIISILSLIGTIAISFVIYFLQRNNEKKAHAKEIKETAKRFIIENSDEIDYLPWATVAVGCFPQNKHCRAIYNHFSFLNDETKIEVLKQRNLDCELIPGDGWIDDKIGLIRDCIAKMGIGNDFLYDGGKYFTRAYDYYKKEEIALYQDQRYNNPICKDEFHVRPVHFGKKGYLTYEQYLDDFLYCKFKEKKYIPENVPLPNDYLIDLEDLRNCDEEKLCYWMMVIVENVIAYSKGYLGLKMKNHTLTDAESETFEDMYFSVLYNLYYLQVPNTES